jgi:hypothetical protein
MRLQAGAMLVVVALLVTAGATVAAEGAVSVVNWVAPQVNFNVGPPPWVHQPTNNTTPAAPGQSVHPDSTDHPGNGSKPSDPGSQSSGHPNSTDHPGNGSKPSDPGSQSSGHPNSTDHPGNGSKPSDPGAESSGHPNSTDHPGSGRSNPTTAPKPT